MGLKTTLKETGIYNYKCAFLPAFKKYKVETVGQVLDDDLMREVMNHCQPFTRNELCGFISLIKYKYLGLPMANSIYLEECPELSTSGLEYRYNVRFCTMGFNSYQEQELKRCMVLYEEQLENMKLIDFFKLIIERGDCKSTTREIIRIYIDSYDQKNHVQSTSESNPEPNMDAKDVNIEVLNLLKEQLEQWNSMKNQAEVQISYLHQKISELSNSQQKVVKPNE